MRVLPVSQNKLFGGLGGIVGSACTVQLEFKRGDGQAVKTVTVKSRKDEQETLPLYTNKDSVQGEVRAHQLSSALRRWVPPQTASACWCGE